MKRLFRHWRGLLTTLVVAFLAAETLVLLSNQTPARLKPVRIEHDESDSSPWLVLRVENPHLSPIRVLGLGGDRETPLAAFQMDGGSTSTGTGWCTSSFEIVVPPLSSREVRILPPKTGEEPTSGYWEVRIWGLNTSMLSWLNRNRAETEILGYHDIRTDLPVTGDPWAKELAAAKRNSCCGGTAEKSADPPESKMP